MSAAETLTLRYGADFSWASLIARANAWRVIFALLAASPTDGAVSNAAKVRAAVRNNNISVVPSLTNPTVP